MYDTRKRRNKADVCRSHGGSYGAVRGGCERLGRDEWKAEIFLFCYPGKIT